MPQRRQEAPLQRSPSFLRGKKINKPASPGPKKQAPPKGSPALTLSRRTEYLIVLECQERQGSALATCVCVGEETGCAQLGGVTGLGLGEKGLLASGYKDSLDPRPGLPLAARPAHERGSFKGYTSAGWIGGGEEGWG